MLVTRRSSSQNIANAVSTATNAADVTTFTFEPVPLDGSSGKVIQQEMIARIKSGIVEAPIDCDKGWCGPPPGNAPEFTINVGHDQHKVYDPVAICEVGWRKSGGGGGGGRGSRFRYFQVDAKRQNEIKQEC